MKKMRKMNRNIGFFAIFLVFFYGVLMIVAGGALVKWMLFDFVSFIKVFLGFAFLIGCMTGVIFVLGIALPKMAELIGWVNEKTKEKNQFSWHHKYAMLIFICVVSTPLIYTVINKGFDYSMFRLGRDFKIFHSLNFHVKFSIILYELILGLFIGLVLNIFKAEKSIEEIKAEYRNFGLIEKFAVSLALMIFLLLDLTVSDAALFGFSDEGKFLLSILSVTVAYWYIKMSDGIEQSDAKRSYAAKLIPLLVVVYLIIAPSSIESHYSLIRAALTEKNDEKMQQKLLESLKRSAYDAFVLTERDVMTQVEPYRYMPTLDEAGNVVIKVTHECTPEAIYHYSHFTNSNYYDLIKDEVASLERLSRSTGAYTDEVKQACFKELNTVWVQRRSQAMKAVFSTACNQKLIAC